MSHKPPYQVLPINIILMASRSLTSISSLRVWKYHPANLLYIPLYQLTLTYGKITFRLRTASCLNGSTQRLSTNDIYLYTGLAVTPSIPIVLANLFLYWRLIYPYTLTKNYTLITTRPRPKQISSKDIYLTISLYGSLRSDASPSGTSSQYKTYRARTSVF